RRGSALDRRHSRIPSTPPRPPWRPPPACGRCPRALPRPAASTRPRAAAAPPVCRRRPCAPARRGPCSRPSPSAPPPAPQRLVPLRAGGEPEEAPPLVHRLRLLLQRRRRGRILLDQRRVLLGDLVHLVERTVYLIDPARLLGARRGDVRHDRSNLLDRFDNLVERGAGPIDQLDALLHLTGAVGDQVLDVLCRLRRALGKPADFRRPHREPASGLAGA